jgi:hypothetical protein
MIFSLYPSLFFAHLVVTPKKMCVTWVCLGLVLGYCVRTPLPVPPPPPTNVEFCTMWWRMMNLDDTKKCGLQLLTLCWRNSPLAHKQIKGGPKAHPSCSCHFDHLPWRWKNKKYMNLIGYMPPLFPFLPSPSVPSQPHPKTSPHNNNSMF